MCFQQLNKTIYKTPPLFVQLGLLQGRQTYQVPQQFESLQLLPEIISPNATAPSHLAHSRTQSKSSKTFIFPFLFIFASSKIYNKKTSLFHLHISNTNTKSLTIMQCLVHSLIMIQINHPLSQHECRSLSCTASLSYSSL